MLSDFRGQGVCEWSRKIAGLKISTPPEFFFSRPEKFWKNLGIMYFSLVPARSAGVELGTWRSDAGNYHNPATTARQFFGAKRPIVPSEQSAFSLPKNDLGQIISLRPPRLSPFNANRSCSPSRKILSTKFYRPRDFTCDFLFRTPIIRRIHCIFSLQILRTAFKGGIHDAR